MHYHRNRRGQRFADGNPNLPTTYRPTGRQSGNGSLTAIDVDNSSSDACGIASLSASPNTFNCSDIETNSVTLTVTDNE
ncbi:MAG: hypothetical protein R2788_25105 [Saprospiraceae bacterium]